MSHLTSLSLCSHTPLSHHLWVLGPGQKKDRPQEGLLQAGVGAELSEGTTRVCIEWAVYHLGLYSEASS